MADNGWAKGYAAGKQSAQGELDWHREEIERLRAALKEIVTLGECYPSPATEVAEKAIGNEQNVTNER